MTVVWWADQLQAWRLLHDGLTYTRMQQGQQSKRAITKTSTTPCELIVKGDVPG